MLNSHGKFPSDPNYCLNRSNTKNILQTLIRFILFFCFFFLCKWVFGLDHDVFLFLRFDLFEALPWLAFQSMRLHFFFLKYWLHSLDGNHIRPQNVYTRRFPTAAVYNLIRERQEALRWTSPSCQHWYNQEHMIGYHSTLLGTTDLGEDLKISLEGWRSV